jgi:putative membrane protein
MNKKQIINILSITIPVVVALLLGIPYKIDLGSWTKALPHAIGLINSLTSICLIAGLYFIKNKEIAKHEKMMLTSFGLGALFLVLYVTYHISNPSTPYGGEGVFRYVYYFLLISHILTSIGVVRIVLLALYYAFEKDFQNHRRITKVAFPIWLYVSVTGVIVYLMISPYYE